MGTREWQIKSMDHRMERKLVDGEMPELNKDGQHLLGI